MAIAREARPAGGRLAQAAQVPKISMVWSAVAAHEVVMVVARAAVVDGGEADVLAAVA